MLAPFTLHFRFDHVEGNKPALFLRYAEIKLLEIVFVFLGIRNNLNMFRVFQDNVLRIFQFILSLVLEIRFRQVGLPRENYVIPALRTEFDISAPTTSTMAVPPSIISSAPVINDESSLAKKAQIPPIS